jgi:hypothetical protein
MRPFDLKKSCFFNLVFLLTLILYPEGRREFFPLPSGERVRVRGTWLS